MRSLAAGLTIIGAMAFGIAIAAPPQQQQQQQQQPQGQGASHPGGQQQAGSGLFPPNQPTPMYSTSANSGTASLQHPSTASPNAGNTGFAGSAGTGRGWNPRVYQPGSNSR